MRETPYEHRKAMHKSIPGLCGKRIDRMPFPTDVRFESIWSTGGPLPVRSQT
jgi:hypothetical protein